MGRPSSAIKIQVVIEESAHPELASILSAVPPRMRAERLRTLALRGAGAISSWPEGAILSPPSPSLAPAPPPEPPQAQASRPAPEPPRETVVEAAPPEDPPAVVPPPARSASPLAARLKAKGLDMKA